MKPLHPRRILVVDDDVEIVNLLQLILSNQGYEVISAGTAEDAYTKAVGQKPDCAILDVVLPGQDGYGLCRQLRQNLATRTMPVLMLTSRGDVADKIAGFEAGANDYLAKPFDAKELGYRVSNLLARSEAAAQPTLRLNKRGQVVAVFGAKGGVGKTTVAVNLAIALKLRMSKQVALRVALFDADFYFGDVAMQLNLPLTQSVVDLVERADLPEGDLIEQVLVSHTSGIRVLLSPARREQAELITVDHVKRLLDLLAAQYDYLIVDCHSSYEQRMVSILQQANVVLVVVTPEIGPIMNAAHFLEIAEKLEIPKENVHIILNRVNSESGIAPGEVERGLHHQISFSLVSGGREVVQSVNRGTPLVLGQPNHPFSQQIFQIADRIIKPVPSTQGDKPRLVSSPAE